MKNNQIPKTLLCYAHGREGSWEAICVDYDVAVQGSSFEEVREILNEAIATYIEDALAESPSDRNRLLGRHAPIYVKFSLAIKFLLYVLFRNSDGDQQANFSISCPA